MRSYMLGKSGRVKSFCEDVCGLLVGFDLNDLDVFLFNIVTDKVMFDFNVFCFGMLKGFFGDMGNDRVVTQNGCLMECDPIVKHLMVYPSDLGTTEGCGNVFGFGGGLGNGGLFLTLP
ncbi:hypothetical protein L1987_64801 [Smallanthus sonchifolius]|uniref:Uncharacterized protein n=1 Tax=Smallanthus sonchifolius TaxID=185202 RepID=A0ACB9BSM0_9ASTR|nr:hypothetical protein L1987_64801 [Smallanthus sonchifolius]